MPTPVTGDSIPGRLRARAAERPNEIALRVVGDDNITYRAWWDHAAAVAVGLWQLDLKPGDRVVLPCASADIISYAVAYAAVQICGGVAVPVLRSHGERFIAETVERARAVGLIGSAKIEGIWCRELGELRADLAAEPAIRATADSTAEILFTSGTTGIPKGVAATHANLLSTHNGASDKPLRLVFHAIPPGTNAGQGLMLLSLHPSPHMVVTVPKFDPKTFLADIETVRPDHVVIVPAHAHAVLRAPDKGADLSSVSLVRSVAAPISGDTLRRLARLFPDAAITSMYTTTEAWPARLSIEYDPRRPDALGKARGGSRVRIVDSHSNDVPPGQLGDVLLRADDPHRRSYDGDAEATRTVFLPSGWVRTGDIGKLDTDGYLYLSDRRTDLVISGGINISTLEVENAAKEFPGVEDAAAFGLPHRTLGQMMALAVAGEVDTLALKAFLYERLGDVKAPGSVFVLAEIPRNALGKPLKAELRQRFALGQSAAASEPTDPALLATLAAIWADVLDRPIPEGVSFRQLGGASFNAAQVVAAVAVQTGRAVEPRDVIRADSVEAFTHLVAAAPEVREEDAQPIPRAPRRETWGE